MVSVSDRLRSCLWPSWLWRQGENSFSDLKERLHKEGKSKRQKKKRLDRQRHEILWHWDRKVKRLLYQLADALKESEQWHDENLIVTMMPPSSDPPGAVGWRLHWVSDQRPPGRSPLVPQSIDIATVLFHLDDKGLPSAFIVIAEETGQQILTDGLSRDELIQAIQKLFR